MRRQQRAQALHESLLGIFGVGIAARGDGRDVHLFEIGGFPWRLAQFHRLRGGCARARCRGSHLLAEERVEGIDLESRTPIAGRHHGDAPIRHGRGWVQRGGLQKAALRLARPERVHLRHALVEESLRFGARRGDGQMYRSHAVQNPGGQRGRQRARRRSAVVGPSAVVRQRSRQRQSGTVASFMDDPPVDAQSGAPVDPGG